MYIDGLLFHFLSSWRMLKSMPFVLFVIRYLEFLDDEVQYSTVEYTILQ